MSTHPPPELKGPPDEVVQVPLGGALAASPCEIVDLVDLLKGATKLEDLRLAMGCLTLVDSMIGHWERDGSLCPRLRLIEASMLSWEIRDRRTPQRLNQ